MQLTTIKILPRGANGWESATLKFGNPLTSLFAPNGSGKTPIVQAIAFCLGFKTKFRDDICEHCEAAVLTFRHDDIEVTVRRDIQSEFHAILETGGQAFEFFDEGGFSRQLFSTLGMPIPDLVGTNKQRTQPYVSTLLPVFYVRQDGGYNEPYRAPDSFIQNQFVEMVRFAFGLNQRHSYDAKRDLLEAREQLEAVQRRIVHQQKLVANLSADRDDSTEAYEALVARAATLTEQIDHLRESVDAQGAAAEALTELLQVKEEQLRKLRREHGELRARLAGIESIRAEIEGEIRTLSLNEESKRAFETFFDICGNSECGLFSTSKESYGKNLLYLKDQIKDIEANTNRAETQIAVLEARIADQDSERKAILSKLKEPEQRTPTSQIVLAAQALTRQLLDAEQQRATLDQIKDERWKQVRLDEERSRLLDRIDTLSGSGQSDLGFNRLRLRIRELTVKWMDILHTPNASRDVDIDLDFRFRFGGEPVDIIGGSTKSRLILAIHAAIFEHYLADTTRPFRFLILDTPKQQELDSEDLKRYLDELDVVCREHRGQVLISASEYRHSLRDGDREWLPEFVGEVQKMYLGSLGRN